jgi:hypothetical protein
LEQVTIRQSALLIGRMIPIVLYDNFFFLRIVKDFRIVKSFHTDMQIK